MTNYAGYTENTGQVILPVAFMRSVAVVSRQSLKGHLDVLAAHVETTKIPSQGLAAASELPAPQNGSQTKSPSRLNVRYQLVGK